MEREASIFKNYKPPMRDYTEKDQVVNQGLLEIEEEIKDPKIIDRIKKAERGELKAKIAVILDRGIVQDRLKVDLPDDIHGEWCRNNPLDIMRLKAMGFRVDNEYAANRAIHSDGSSGAIVGDVVHMICSKELKEIIDEIRLERMIRQHEKKKVGSKELNKEEIEFIENVRGEGDPNVIPYSQSSTTDIDKSEIARILEQIEKQTKKFE